MMYHSQTFDWRCDEGSSAWSCISIVISVCLTSDALSQCLTSYLDFSYPGHGVCLHGCSSKVQLLLLTWDEGYLHSATASEVWETQQWPWRGSFFFPIPRKAMPKNVQTNAQLHSSHTLVKKYSKFSSQAPTICEPKLPDS